MNGLKHFRLILPALLATALTAVDMGCDSGAAPTEVARGTLQLEPPTATIAPGEVLIIPFRLSDGSAPIPSVMPAWSSSDSGVALISPQGVATALAPGTTWITAEQDGGRDSLLLTVRSIRYRQIVAGDGWSCGLTLDAALYCWGRVLTGLVPERTFPLRIAPELRFDRLALEDLELCALQLTGDLYCARGTRVRTLEKQPGGPYLEISPGAARCALTLTGSTVCGGSNLYGNGGIGDFRHMIPFPSQVEVPPLAAVDAGSHYPHTCGRTPEGEVWCWGRNAYSELGDGTRRDSPSPVRMKTDLRFRQIEAGNDFTCGISHDREMWCWGVVLFGGPEESISKLPYRVSLPHPVSKIESGYFRSLCALAGGEVWCMGGLQRAAPHPIAGFPPLVDLSVGHGHVCGTTEDGEGWCSGSNIHGQRGNGSLDSPQQPTRVADRSR